MCSKARKGRNIILLWIPILLLIVSCNRSDNPAEQRAITAGKSTGNIKIAAVSPWSQKRNLLYQGIKQACDEINNSGGLLGRQVEIITFDDDNDVGKGQKKAYEIATDEEIVAVIGHSASSISLPNALLYHYYGIFMLSPLSTNEKLTQQGFSKVFRNIPTDGIFGREAANFCKEKGWKKVLIYYQDNSYGESLANAFEMQCLSAGVVVEDRESYDNNSGFKNYEEIALFWQRNYNFDAVYMTGIMPQAGEIISALRRSGIDQPIIGGDAFDHPLLYETAGQDADNVYAVTIYDDKSEWEAFQIFQKDFMKKYGKEADQAALQGYDALMVLAEGIRRAESIIPEEIAIALRSLEIWEGPAGPYHFDMNGDILGKGVVVKMMKDGEFSKVW